MEINLRPIVVVLGLTMAANSNISLALKMDENILLAQNDISTAGANPGADTTQVEMSPIEVRGVALDKSYVAPVASTGTKSIRP